MNRAKTDEPTAITDRERSGEWISAMTPSVNNKGANGSGTLRCLIVDDIATNQRILQHLVGRCGMETTSCGSGEEALELCRQQVYHLVLMDLHMPAMSGYEAGERILSLREDQPLPLLFAQTADETPDAMERTTRIGFDGHLTKPIRPHEIERIVGRIQRLSHAP